jgi:hypothetical protein
MQIKPAIRKKYVKLILRTVKASSTPPSIPEMLGNLHSANGRLDRDLAVAFMWHLLSRQVLAFDSSRKLVVA